MATDDLQFQSLLGVSDRIQRREISAVELTRAALDRIERLEPQLHSFTTVMPEFALAQAERADAELRRGQSRGPLHGVPIAVKDLLDTRGHRTAAGTMILRDNVPDTDATVVERFEQAGAVLLGKLALTEGAYAEHHPEITPPVNPWSAAHWTGVSSSGSGVSIAAGLCYGALGTDTGGSIRFPSFACGITGLKPTWGRVSRAGCFALAASLDHIGPMARSAADCAAVLGVIAGPDPRDPTAIRAAVPDYLRELNGTGALRGIKIGVDRNHALQDTERTIAESFADALDAFAELGAEIRDITLPEHSDLVRDWVPLCAVETALAHADLFPTQSNRYGPGLRGLIELGQRVSAADYARIMERRRGFTNELEAMFEDVDVLALPSSILPTPRLDRLAEGLRDSSGVERLIRFTAPFDLTGSPTLSLPSGFDEAGMPVGFQLIGPRLGEALLLRAGDAFQRVTDWHTYHPPI